MGSFIKLLQFLINVKKKKTTFHLNFKEIILKTKKESNF